MKPTTLETHLTEPAPRRAVSKSAGRLALWGCLAWASLCGNLGPNALARPPYIVIWYQVNQDGFGYGPYYGGAVEPRLFTFDQKLYAYNTNGVFRIEDVGNKEWTQLAPPAPPAGPGAQPASFTVIGDYLYAWRPNKLWCIAKGQDLNGPNWALVTSVGTPDGISPQPMVLYNGMLYAVRTLRNAGGAAKSFDIWRTAQVGLVMAWWERVEDDSFGDSTNNHAVDVMTVFNDRIYAMTETLGPGASFANTSAYGCGVQVWESPSGDAGSWTQVNENGFGTLDQQGHAIHQIVGCAAAYQGTLDSQQYLYVGTKAHYGAEVWRYDGNGKTGWQNVTPPWAGPSDMFDANSKRNSSMVVFNNWLYLAEGVPSCKLSRCDGVDWQLLVNGAPFDPNQSLGQTGRGLTSLAIRSVPDIYGSQTDSLYVYVQTALGYPIPELAGDQVWAYPKYIWRAFSFWQHPPALGHIWPQAPLPLPSLRLGFEFNGPAPQPQDVIKVHAAGIQLLAAPFSAFKPDTAAGRFMLERPNVTAWLDTANRAFTLVATKVALPGVKPEQNAEIGFAVGRDVLVQTIKFHPSDDSSVLYGVPVTDLP